MGGNHIRILCSVLKVDLVFESADGNLVPFFYSIQDSPLMQSGKLRDVLREGIRGQEAPYLDPTENNVWFAAFHSGDGFLFMGPMCGEKLSAAKQRHLYRTYGIDETSARVLPPYTLTDIRNMVLLTNSSLENDALENEELIHLNRIIRQTEKSIRTEQTQYVLNEEAENDAHAIRHSYYEEQLLMLAIREGRPEDAVRLAENMDTDTGRLSKDEVSHRRNLAIIGIALCARAGIEAGLTPEECYRLSGYYIQKCDNCQDLAHLLHYRNRAIEELAGRIREKRSKSRSSSYVERSKSYIRTHYREKIYLDKLAQHLGISPSYLSRIFKNETGQCLQDYVNEPRVDRAASLLIYSDRSLSEISEYVNFPNQSYFGKIFKQFRHMTPREYRDRFTPTDKN